MAKYYSRFLLNWCKPVLFCCLTLVLFVSCKDKNLQTQKTVPKDTIFTAKIPVTNQDSNLKRSKPFLINGIECYWEQTDTLQDDGRLDLIKLKDCKTNRILISHTECCLKNGFDFYSSDNFADVNFDGFKDFLIRSYGSTAMFEITTIYLFDNKTKNFIYSDLSDNIIEKDSINRKLITTSYDKDFEKVKTVYFDKIGKIKYIEVVTEYSEPTEYKTFEKIVNGKVVEKKVDSLKTE